MARKKRLLIVNEASYRNSGYARYGRELTKRLHASGQYEIAELACSHQDGDEACSREASRIPWLMYPAVPNNNSQELLQEYSVNPIHQFGKLYFERTCLSFKPDIVMSWRDYWMDSFIQESPFREYYKFIHMPTVDAEPQNPSWVDMYKNCDKLLTYNKWSKSVLERYGLEVYSDAPPKAPDCFRLLPKLECKGALGLPLTGKVIGTVMRNQPRKLFDELFTAFKQLLEETGEEYYLYCHTGFPDSWCDIPDLLIKHGISNKVFITYRCMDKRNGCNATNARRYFDVPAPCYKCGQISAGTATMNNQVNDMELAYIFNSFDIYVQYASLEGFGMSCAEAAACGVVPLAVDYSAMSSVVRECKGLPIEVASKSIEVETGRYKAAPDIDHTVKMMKLALDNSEALGQTSFKACQENFNWDRTAGIWMKCIEDVGYGDWSIEPRTYNIPEFDVGQGKTNKEYVEWLYDNVSYQPHLKNSYMAHKLISNLNLGSEQQVDGMPNKYIPIDRSIAFNRMAGKTQEKNIWESERMHENSVRGTL